MPQPRPDRMVNLQNVMLLPTQDFKSQFSQSMWLGMWPVCVTSSELKTFWALTHNPQRCWVVLSYLPGTCATFGMYFLFSLYMLVIFSACDVHISIKKSFLFKLYHSSSAWWMSELSAVKEVMSSMKELPDWLIAIWVCMTRKTQFSLQGWHELSIAISVSPQSLFITNLCQCLQTWTNCQRLMPDEPPSYRFQEKQFKHFQEPLKQINWRIRQNQI